MEEQKVYIVIDKNLSEDDAMTFKLYGAYSDKELAIRVSNHVSMLRRGNPFLKGNLRDTSWQNNVGGFIRHTRPKVVELELDQYSTTTLRLDRYTIDTFWKTKEGATT